ncbi:MAG TPA: glycosyltransferase [Opitutaceae bacterium]|jgi:glycosyltransferase involved in cell wall biosynthesis|nr:glycosyltransferase [Opitutaceae bacterium]
MDETKKSPKPSLLLVVEPGLDGVFRHVEGLVSYLFNENIRVHLAYSSRRCGAAMLDVVARVRAAGGEAIDLKVTNVPEFRDITALFSLMSLIRRAKPDVIHVHSSKAGALGRIAALLLRHGRCFYSPQAYYGMAKPLTPKVRFYNWIERILGGIGTTIAISQDEATFAREILRVPASCVRVIHNPVDSSCFTPATNETRQAARAALGIPENTVVLAIIARMCWQKDPETAYAGVAPVCAANPDLMLVHLGWGKWHDYLKEFGERHGMGKQLRILDYTDDPRAFYHAIDGLLVSSRYEAGWPLVFLEGMACNLPIVAATGMGMSDVGRAELSHVWTFPPENIAGCTSAVTQWLARQRKGFDNCNHRAFAIERLSPERCYGAIVRLYENKENRGGVSPFEDPLPSPQARASLDVQGMGFPGTGSAANRHRPEIQKPILPISQAPGFPTPPP